MLWERKNPNSKRAHGIRSDPTQPKCEDKENHNPFTLKWDPDNHSVRRQSITPECIYTICMNTMVWVRSFFRERLPPLHVQQLHISNPTNKDQDKQDPQHNHQRPCNTSNPTILTKTSWHPIMEKQGQTMRAPHASAKHCSNKPRVKYKCEQ